MAKSVQQKIARLPKVGDRAFLEIDRRFIPGYLTWPQLVEYVAHVRPDEVSFDVFDTVISRSVVGDASIDWIVGQQLARCGIWPGTAESYLAARQEAQLKLDVSSLTTIYDTEPMAAVTDVDEAVSIEVSVEHSVCKPVPGALEALRKIRQLCGSVTFLSDMHLHHNNLHSLLVKSAFFEAGDRLIVSGDEGVSKFDGELFQQVWPERSGRNVLHIGNSDYSDGLRAVQAGLRTVIARRANPSHYERVLAEPLGTFGPVIAGAARQARLHLGSTGHPAESAAIFSTQIIGMTLQAFLLWVRRKAVEKGISQIVFFAGSGELVLAMAKAMPDDYWEDYSLRCLQYDRRSWSLSEASVMGIDRWVDKVAADDVEHLRLPNASISVEKLVSRVGLDLSTAESSHHLDGIVLDEKFPSDRAESWRSFLGEPSVRSNILAESQRHRGRAIAALKVSEIKAEATVFVDIGGSSRAAVVSALMEEAFEVKMSHLHLFEDGMSPGADEATEIQHYLLDEQAKSTFTAQFATHREMVSRSRRPREADRGRLEDEAIERPNNDSWLGAVEVARQMPSCVECLNYGFDVQNGLAGEVANMMSLSAQNLYRNDAKFLVRLRHKQFGPKLRPAVESR